MATNGWRDLLPSASAFRGEGNFPIAAYSEFMPPPRIAVKPSGAVEYDSSLSDDDPFGWRITAQEQERQLAPGLPIIGRQIIETVVALAAGHGRHRIGAYHLKDNPYWPAALGGGLPPHE